MTFALRPPARSRRLRAMGMLAWLMLVINALAAAPMSTTQAVHAHRAHATAAVDSGTSLGSCCADQPAACDDITGFACHCVAMCSITLAPAGLALPTSAAITVRYAALLPAGAPSLDVAPPLRPPAA